MLSTANVLTMASLQELLTTLLEVNGCLGTDIIMFRFHE